MSAHWLGLSSRPPDQEVYDANEERLLAAEPRPVRRHVHDDRTVHALRGGAIVQIIECVICGSYDEFPPNEDRKVLRVLDE